MNYPIDLVSACILLVQAQPQSRPATQESPPFRLQSPFAGRAVDDAVVLVVPPDGLIPFSLLMNPSGPTSRPVDDAVDLYLTPFVSGDKSYGDVRFELPKGHPTNSPQHLTLPSPTERSLPIRLVARSLKEGTDYKGKLSLVIGSNPPLVWDLILSAPARPRAQLSINRKQIDTRITLPFGRRHRPSDASILFTLTEESGIQAVEGLTLRPDESTSSPTGDLSIEDHLRFTLDARPAPGLLPSLSLPRGAHEGSLPPASASSAPSIPAGGQVSLGIEFHDLSPGTHRFGFRVRSPNAAGLADTPITATVHVKDHILPPALVLLLAMAVSYFATKGLRNWRQRLLLRQEVATLRPSWLDSLPQARAVVWLRTIRKQVDDLARKRMFLPAPRILNLRIQRGRQLLELLSEVRHVVAFVDAPGLPYLFHHRASYEINRFLRLLDDPDVLSEDSLKSCREQLSQLREWTTDPRGKYWRTVQRIRDAFLAQIDKSASPFTEPPLSDLLQKIELKSDPGNLQAISEIDDALAGLELARICLSKSDATRLQALLTALREQKPLRETFRIFDLPIWDRLQQAIDAGEVSIEPDRGRQLPEPVEALRPVDFSLKFRNPDLAKEYLVHSGVSYQWSFQFSDSGLSWLRKAFAKRQSTGTPPPSPPFGATAKGTRIVQYAPRKGTLSVSVTLHYHDGYTTHNHTGPTASVPVRRPREFARLRSYQWAELVSLALATLVAEASGLASLYLSNDTFGSLGDYAKLFFLGVGADQGKNLIQILTQYSEESEKQP